jgi:hypothetical protein
VAISDILDVEIQAQSTGTKVVFGDGLQKARVLFQLSNILLWIELFIFIIFFRRETLVPIFFAKLEANIVLAISFHLINLCHVYHFLNYYLMLSCFLFKNVVVFFFPFLT